MGKCFPHRRTCCHWKVHVERVGEEVCFQWERFPESLAERVERGWVLEGSLRVYRKRSSDWGRVALPWHRSLAIQPWPLHGFPHLWDLHTEKDAWLVEWNPLKFAIFKFRVGVGFHSVVVWSRWCRTASSWPLKELRVESSDSPFLLLPASHAGSLSLTVDASVASRVWGCSTAFATERIVDSPDK